MDLNCDELMEDPRQMHVMSQYSGNRIQLMYPIWFRRSMMNLCLTLDALVVNFDVAVTLKERKKV